MMHDALSHTLPRSAQSCCGCEWMKDKKIHERPKPSTSAFDIYIHGLNTETIAQYQRPRLTSSMSISSHAGHRPKCLKSTRCVNYCRKDNYNKLSAVTLGLTVTVEHREIYTFNITGGNISMRRRRRHATSLITNTGVSRGANFVPAYTIPGLSSRNWWIFQEGCVEIEIYAPQLCFSSEDYH